MSKVNILALNSDTDGVGYYRILNPLTNIIDDDVNVEIRLLSDPTIPIGDENYLKQFNIIYYNKRLMFQNNQMYEHFMNIVRRNNIKIVYDIDDFWILNSNHVNYAQWKKTNTREETEKLLGEVDYVVTTTELFANKIKEINENVHVFENALNSNEYQWNHENKLKSDKIRFLWGGGITHMPDLNLMKKSFTMFDNDFLNKAQLYLCGFDLRIRTPKGIIKGDPRTSQWTKFENLFTNNRKWIKNNDYYKYLMTYDDTNYGIKEEFRHEFYQRRWTKPILTYGTMYHEADVVLAPLKGNMMFNYYKSQLKVIEAGVYKCPIIASNYGPYTLDIEDGVDGFLIDENKPLEWYEKMKWFVDNPNAVEDMGEKLHEKIMGRYHMDVVNKKRIDFLKSIV